MNYTFHTAAKVENNILSLFDRVPRIKVIFYGLITHTDFPATLAYLEGDIQRLI